MSLKKIFFKTKLSYKIYLYYNLYLRNKCFLNKSQYSQWGEDIFISDYFKNKSDGIYFDVGCFHPIMYSNTCLLHKKGWSGINIDINPTSIDLFNIIRPKDINLCTTIDDKKKEYKVYFDHPFSPINTLDKEYYNSFKDKFFKEGSSITIKSKSIDEILNPSKIKNINFLNIDVEGMDFKILHQLIPNKMKPELISIETHKVDGSKSQDCDKINDHLKDNNFKTFKRVGPTTLFSG